jgi:glucokinase
VNDDDGPALALDVGGTTIKAELVERGGGLSRAGAGLLDLLRVALRQRTPVVHPAGVTVSALGDPGGVVGAALLARDGWAPES